MSNAWTCKTCGHGSKYGGAPAIALHNAVSHGAGERITEIPVDCWFPTYDPDAEPAGPYCYRCNGFHIPPCTFEPEEE